MLVFIAAIPLPRVDNHLVGSDGVKYYAILRSLVLDQDFDFANDFSLLDVAGSTVEATGKVANPFAIGTALLWLPFFLLAHALSLILNTFGFSISTNGVNYLYESTVLIGSILYASLGFFLTYQTVRRLFTVRVALIAILGMWWGTQAIYYIIAEPSMSHAMTILANALFLYIWYPSRPNRSARDWLILGLVTALVALVRWQEGLLALVPIVELGWWVWRKKLSLSKGVRYLLLFSITVLVGFSPQFLMWSQVYGSPLLIPQGANFMHWFSPEPLLTLFSTQHGLITWHPIFLFALLGLVPLWRRDRTLTMVVLGAFLAQLYINSAADHWWADDAFGGRRFTGLIPFLVLPLSALTAWVQKHKHLRWLIIALLVLILWNGLSFAQYRFGFVSKSEALTLRELTLDRLLLPWTIFRLILG
ncbi:MAG: hypothetical protein GY805_34965 [Chloroflexi bacterium]|nr:hypothetical protein [Chloroflexota bacterium]